MNSNGAECLKCIFADTMVCNVLETAISWTYCSGNLSRPLGWDKVKRVSVALCRNLQSDCRSRQATINHK
ncbi:uncharacterized protein PHALS_10070 [Plasmopara halstedii]|uniref:Uncharacterized protein n=1 Tax=Plasmopara halstedii TaxID=4781 RepID=A0A0P1AGS6_PLAHL|nr:uncharacterized protein PHALS_10070 [Plasmopara halstedii]CEG39836.1 hypothetical protein PHALS_10070 [Plasmopara halstedii]|eukprot:XP_024576205.1 hypothetical protein PHALS_10070 [Plasmopara halstedii]